MSFSITNKLTIINSGKIQPKPEVVIFGLKYWFDASAAGSVESSTGVPATNGQTVSTWKDVSGNNLNLTATNKPTYQTNQINSKAAVYFNSNFMSGTGVTTSGSTIIAVAATPVATIPPSGVGFIFSSTRYATVPTFELYTYNGFVSTSQRQVGSPNGAAAFTVYKNGSSSALSLNQNEWCIATCKVSSFDLGASSAGIYVGKANASGTDYFGINKIAEIIVYNRPLTNSELNSVHGTLGRKYNISVSTL